ncbi:adenine-specific methyltransferase EcoRI family protein [Mycoplasmopsis agassizii]|uniref:adenine-specific methyltransferase EcoRI family protein n=2 Tax=Mycoplasmopsis agassizii TaxID=33922 RepID=UPI0009D8AA40|nr:adenine-specific methyltransferase EcoRI family protein [Mycoplasmopsis agassizii]SMC19717.1 Adenine-specific methyltransferase EcoRI [Mycoplasmopsis agassizii]
MGNEHLSKAKNLKNDEFYTQYDDIQNEVNYYYEYDPNVFRDKVIFLPCDDPEWSNFTKFFAINFEKFGIKKLISTSYAHSSKKVNFSYQQTLFEEESPQFDYDKSQTRGKIFTLTREKNNKKIDYNDLKWKYLEGDGDFRSKECVELIKKSDIVITNPPFSLFREFISHIFRHNKKFLIIGSKLAAKNKDMFPLIKEDKVWLGRTSAKKFYIFIENEKHYTSKINGLTRWFTNLEHGLRHEKLKLLTMQENLIYDKRLIKAIREAGQRSRAEKPGREAGQRSNNYNTLNMITTMM